MILAVLYFIPSIVAWARSVKNVGSIIVVNVFLGWTFIGWVVALAWACSSSKQQPTAPPPGSGWAQVPPQWPAPQPSTPAPSVTDDFWKPQPS